MSFIEKHLSRTSSEKASSRLSGALGEEEAVRTLKKLNYKIIERNFSTKTGEIDIIAKDGEYTCFVEVRLRKGNAFGSPAETIDWRKQQRIINTAKLYAIKNAIFDTAMRFDAVLINADVSGGELHNIKTEVIKNAFSL